MTENDHLGDWIPEKDCCLRLTFRQPVQKSSSELSLDSEDGFRTGCRDVSRKKSPSQDFNQPDDLFQSRRENNEAGLFY